MFWTVPCHTCGVVLQLFYTSRKTINKSNSVGSAYLKISSLLPPWKMNAEQSQNVRSDFCSDILPKLLIQMKLFSMTETDQNPPLQASYRDSLDYLTFSLCLENCLDQFLMQFWIDWWPFSLTEPVTLSSRKL